MPQSPTRVRHRDRNFLRGRSMKKASIQGELLDLFYVNEATLASTDEDDFMNLYELDTPPSEVAAPAVREAYIAFLQSNGYEIPS